MSDDALRGVAESPASLEDCNNYLLLLMLRRKGWRLQEDCGDGLSGQEASDSPKMVHCGKTANRQYLLTLLRSDEIAAALGIPVHHQQVAAYYSAILHLLDMNPGGSELEQWKRHLVPHKTAKHYKALMAGRALPLPASGNARMLDNGPDLMLEDEPSCVPIRGRGAEAAAVPKAVEAAWPPQRRRRGAVAGQNQSKEAKKQAAEEPAGMEEFMSLAVAPASASSSQQARSLFMLAQAHDGTASVSSPSQEEMAGARIGNQARGAAKRSSGQKLATGSAGTKKQRLIQADVSQPWSPSPPGTPEADLAEAHDPNQLGQSEQARPKPKASTRTTEQREIQADMSQPRSPSPAGTPEADLAEAHDPNQLGQSEQARPKPKASTKQGQQGSAGGRAAAAPAGTLSTMFDESDESTVWMHNVPIIKRSAPSAGSSADSCFKLTQIFCQHGATLLCVGAFFIPKASRGLGLIVFQSPDSRPQAVQCGGYYVTCPLHRAERGQGGRRLCKKEMALSGRPNQVVVRSLAWWLLQGSSVSTYDCELHCQLRYSVTLLSLRNGKSHPK